MKNIYKFRITTLILLFAATALIMSCEKQDNHYATGDFIVSFGVVKSNIESSGNYLFHLDNGDKFVAIAPSTYFDHLQPNQRVLVNFAPFDDKINADNSKTIYGKVNLVKNIQYEEVQQLSPANKDSLGKDPVVVRDSWITGDSILTIDFTYLMEGNNHTVSLVNTSTDFTIGKPYLFEFHHNANGDRPIYKASGYASFKLNRFKIAGQHQTVFNLIYTDYEGKQGIKSHQINY